MSGSPTVIYSAASVQQAYLLKSLLEDQGIAAWVVNDSIQIAGGELPLGWSAAAKVVVGETDASEGRKLAEAFDSRTAHEPSPEPGERATSPGSWEDWPTCPECGERRAARCPVCSVSGSAFPLVDRALDGDEDRVLLFCQACDDHFLPEWFRLCPRCGHDFGDGVLIGEQIGSLDGADRRSWAAIALLTLLGLTLLAYFAWLLR